MFFLLKKMHSKKISENQMKWTIYLIWTTSCVDGMLEHPMSHKTFLSSAFVFQDLKKSFVNFKDAKEYLVICQFFISKICWNGQILIFLIFSKCTKKCTITKPFVCTRLQERKIDWFSVVLRVFYQSTFFQIYWAGVYLLLQFVLGEDLYFGCVLSGGWRSHHICPSIILSNNCFFA